jgi:hypothetical protein
MSMEHHSHTGESAEEERWFDTASSGPEPEGDSSNQRRGSSLFRPSTFFTWFLFLLLLTLLLSLAFLKDDEMPWDGDLMQAIPTEIQEDMSAPLRMKVLLLTANKVDMSSLSAKPPDQWDTPALVELLEANSEVLDNFRDLLEEKEQEWEATALLWKLEDFCEDPGWPAILLLKQAEAAYLGRSGQEQQAFLAAIDMAVLATLLERLDAWPSFTERALDLHERSAQSLAELLRNTQLNGETLRNLQENEYAPWQPSLERLRVAMGGFYTFERKLLLGPSPGEPPLPIGYTPARSGWLFFKPNATLKLFVESFRELRIATSQTSFARAHHISERLQRRMAGSWSYTNPNSSGEDYYASRIHYYAGLPDRVSLAQARYALVMHLFAVRRFVAGELRVPQTLEEMKAYLTKPLLDPFSGEPLRYDPKRGLIYSVGADLIDEGGKVESVSMSDRDEPTIETGIGMARATR